MMTLDEAIKHAEETGHGDCACAVEHRQLARWLRELKQRRRTARADRWLVVRAFAAYGTVFTIGIILAGFAPTITHWIIAWVDRLASFLLR
jgi:hypothetical protein